MCLHVTRRAARAALFCRLSAQDLALTAALSLPAQTLLPCSICSSDICRRIIHHNLLVLLPYVFVKLKVIHTF